MAQRQVNIRIDETDVDVLEAAAFVDRQGLADAVRSAVSSHVEALRDDPDVQEVLRVREARSGKLLDEESSVSSLDDRRQRTGNGNA